MPIDLDMLFLLLGALIVGCVLCSKLSGRLNMPSLLIFLCIGIVVRLLVINFCQHDLLFGSMSVDDSSADIRLWRLANGIGTMALAFILFSGGFDTSWKTVRPVLKVGGILSSLGVLLTALLVAVFANYLFCVQGIRSVPFVWCFLLGAVISSTDAAAVFSILRSRSVSLKGNIQAVLEFESGSNDPMAAFLTLFLVSMISSGNESIGWNFLQIFPIFALKMGIGAGVGVLVAKVSVKLFNRLSLEYDGLYYVLGVGIVLVAFALAQCCWGNGYMSVYAAGIYLSEHRFVFHNGFKRFSTAVSWLMQVILFTMLGFLASPNYVLKYGMAALVIGLFLMFVARPLACLICTHRSHLLDCRARILISWVGLRGGAPILLATFPVLMNRLTVNFSETAGDAVQTDMSQFIFHVVFVVVLLSMVLQGLTIMPLAKLLKLDAPLDNIPTSPLSFDITADHGNTVLSTGPEVAGEKDFSGTYTKTFVIAENSRFANSTLATLGLPTTMFVLTIRRGSRYIIPKGASILRAGDEMTILGDAKTFAELDAIIDEK